MAFPFLPFSSPSRPLPLLCAALLSPHQTTSSRCRRRWQGVPAAAAMFSWILRGCRDECSASDQLKQARDVFVAKEAVLQKKISQEMERAKEFTKSGNKQAAMQCLKRKKYYESQMSQVGSVQLRINTKEKMIADHMGNK
ncbi:hypothetical protein SEVIR_2G330200v4 [Setaria viridis]|uniref:Uncharacterized protein n=4 Tax=Paniceae TaxID=147428 RepID=A0A368Q5D4_SETIT|nr:vacuolar protein sorting-associated protein 32 homolog 1-like [Setaria viridis]RCV13092.1 hypothetical protein SETIT_2G319100v2 [Setaria italica]TKW34807.1 hypothetical protein SEVIR_2G330200v2 [Setaria viridis]TKW34808.1 hypothetical protein SEVIR_2G330200v2 [Setaria viridis]TKW34809.1 hypothetical protein SEVIR_2G330200v2 [Setaria viridis]